MSSKPRSSDLEYVRDNYRHILGRSPGCHWKPIERGLAAGSHRTLIFRQGGQRCGFAVFTVQDTGAELWFDIAGLWLEGRVPWDGLVALVEGKARSLGCSRVVFGTVRNGWLRRLAKYGYSQSPYISIHRDIEEGAVDHG